MPENRGSEGKKSTKTPILCSKRPKMGGGSECKKRTKMGLLCAFLFRKAAHCGPRCLRLDLGTAQLWSNHLRPVLRLASGLVANEPTVCEADCLRGRLLGGADCLQGRLPTNQPPTNQPPTNQPSAEPTACGADRLRTNRLRG